MRSRAACSLGSAWQREASTASLEKRFALRHPTGIRGCVSLSALPVSKNVTLLQQCAFSLSVHRLPGASGPRVLLSPMQCSLGLSRVVGAGARLPSSRIFLRGYGKQFSLKITIFYPK